MKQAVFCSYFCSSICKHYFCCSFSFIFLISYVFNECVCILDFGPPLSTKTLKLLYCKVRHTYVRRDKWTLFEQSSSLGPSVCLSSCLSSLMSVCLSVCLSFCMSVSLWLSGGKTHRSDSLHSTCS